MLYLLAQDIGTSAAKATLFSAEGQLLRTCSTAYTVDEPHPGWAQQDAMDWWLAFCENNRIILEGIDVSQLAAVSVSGQMMGCLPVAQTGEPLGPALIWADGRALEEAEQIRQTVGHRRFFSITGMSISENYSLPKILWIRKHFPEIYEKTYCFLQSKDFITQKLTGEFVTESSDAQYYHAYDIIRNCWSQELLDVFCLDGNKFPRLVKAGTPVGTVRQEIAEECHLPAGTPVVEGLGDGRAALIGTGVLSIGDAYISLGTSSWISLISTSAELDPDRGEDKIVFIEPGVYVCGGTMNAGGYSFDWMRRTLCQPEERAAREAGTSVYEQIDLLTAGSGPGAGGVMFLPYLLGERDPYLDPNVRGAFLGLSSRSTRADMCRSVMEGVAMHLNLFKQQLEQTEQIHSMRIVGGGAKNPVWRQIFADIFNMPILETNVSDEAGSLGTAVMAGIGVGLYRDVSVVHRFQKVLSITYPNPENRKLYDEMQNVFNGAYAAVRDISHALTHIQERSSRP